MGVGCTFSKNIKAFMGMMTPAPRLDTSLAGEALAKALVLRTAAEQTFFFLFSTHFNNLNHLVAWKIFLDN